MDKYKNKYRIPSARASWWDYGWSGGYFVTICTKNRKHFFGNVVEGRMDLSPLGHIANSCWLEIPNHFPFVKLAPHVIMPNHMHGIVIIDKPGGGVGNGQGFNVETQNIASLSGKPKNKFGPQSGNLASIIRGFKTGVTKNARQLNSDFAWQSRFHDHIIRDDAEFQRIAHYIINNPAKWDEDKFHS